MKLPCKVVEDMLPIYHDGVCSAESAALIEEHLESCPQCSSMLSQLRADIEIPKISTDDTQPLKKIQKRMQRKRLRALIAIAIILALLPVAFLAGNSLRRQVIGYSEREALICANSFMDCLVVGDYANACSYLDLEDKKHEWLERWFTEEELINFEDDALAKFCELGRSKVEAFGGIEAYNYVEIDSQYAFDYRGNNVYCIHYTVQFAKKSENFDVLVTKNGICGMSAADGYLKHPLVQFCIWSEWLWQDYQGCYYDFDLKTYVYYDQAQ